MVSISGSPSGFTQCHNTWISRDNSIQSGFSGSVADDLGFLKILHKGP